MSTHAMPKTAITLDPNASEHHITLSVIGGAIKRMEGLAPPDEDYLPDPVPDFISAINHGFFGEAAHATLHEKQWHEDKQTYCWQLTLAHVPWEIFKILVNLFCFFEPEEVHCQSDATETAPLALDKLHFPPPPQHLPFKIVLNEDDREILSSISLVFAQELSDNQAQNLIPPLENWSNLVLMGAYKEDEENEPVVIPDGVYWSDAFTLTTGFSEAFDADSAAFNAVLHFACVLVKQTYPVNRIEME